MVCVQLPVDFRTGPLELICFFLHPDLNRLLLADLLAGGVVPHILCNFHGTEVRATHAAEVGNLGGIVGQRFVVEVFRCVGIEREIELILPAELEARLRQSVVSYLCTRMTLGQIRGMSSDLIGDDVKVGVITYKIAAPMPEVMWS